MNAQARGERVGGNPADVTAEDPAVDRTHSLRVTPKINSRLIPGSRPAPCGQRPEDLVAWVVEHYPDLVEERLRDGSPSSARRCPQAEAA